MPLKIFFSYAHQDESLMRELKHHLKVLELSKLIEIWYDRDISAGTEWEQEIDKHLNAADIILLLISSDFLASEYCYSIEMKRALERREKGEAYIIPIILRPVYWQEIDTLAHLQALPKDGKPVEGPYWGNKDAAFLDIVKGIRKVVQKWPPHVSVVKEAPRQRGNISVNNINLDDTRHLSETASVQHHATWSLLENRLSTEQKQFLKAFLSQAGEQAVEKKFSYIRQGKSRYLRWKSVKIDLNVTDGDLLELARWGYLRIYASSRSIFFTKQTLEVVSDSLERGMSTP